MPELQGNLHIYTIYRGWHSTHTHTYTVHTFQHTFYPLFHYLHPHTQPSRPDDYPLLQLKRLLVKVYQVER